MQKLASDQRAAPFSQHLAGVDALDAERNLGESEVDEIDDGYENQQDSDNGQRDHDSLVRRSFRSPYIPLEMCIMQIAQAESLADTVNFVRIHIIAKKRY